MSAPQFKRKRSKSPSLPPSTVASKRARTAIPSTNDKALMSKVMAAARKPRRPVTKPRPSRDELVERIRAFVEKHGAIRQGTSTWYDLMRTTVGGSEMSVLLDLNKYKKRDQLLEEKRETGVSRDQEAPVPCLWGKLFEPIIRTYIEVVYDTRIYGHDICIKNGRLRYSPDGLGVVCRINGRDIFDVVLFEFKCPYIRIPDGKVPKHYEPQVWSGLAATEEIEPAYGFYVDAVFRKCRQDQLNRTSDYDRQYHSRGRPSYGRPVAWGLMNVYSKNDDVGKGIIDYGVANREEFDQMLKDVDKGVMNTFLVHLTFADGRTDILGPQGHVDGMRLTGVIPFKLMRVCHKRVRPIPNFGERAVREVEKFFDDVNN
jgi:hypothetical protein